MRTSSSFGMAFGTVILGFTGLIMACGGADNLDVLGAAPGATGTGTSGETSSGATSGGTSGATSGGTSGGTSSSGNTSSGSTSGQSSSGCVKCGIALPAGCSFTSPCGCEFTCPDGGGPLKCNWTPDGTGGCPEGSYCDAPDCITGVCVKRADATAQDRSPQCGCNGVTYWNATFAKKAGMAIRGAGACALGTAKTCGAGAPCPNGGSCNLQVPKKSECNGGTTGSCWVLPATCPAVVVGGRSRPCGAAVLTCTDDCTAIKKQTQWYDDGSCPQ